MIFVLVPRESSRPGLKILRLEKVERREHHRLCWEKSCTLLIQVVTFCFDPKRKMEDENKAYQVHEQVHDRYTCLR